MKISASYWMFEGGLEAKRPIAEAMQEAKDLGFDAIELAVASQGVLRHNTTQAQCEDIIADADKIGIEISSVASGESWNCSPSANDPDVRKKIIDFTGKALQVAGWLGVDAYLFVPGAVDVFFKPDYPPVPYDVVWERSLAALKELAPYAEENGVHICVENVWNKFLLSPLEMRQFVDEINSPYVGCYFDAGNVLLFGYPQDWIRILGSRIKRVHIKGYKKGDHTLKGFCDLLKGDVPWKEVMKALKEVGYDGPVTAEMLPWKKGLIRRTSRAMDQILAM